VYKLKKQIHLLCVIKRKTMKIGIILLIQFALISVSNHSLAMNSDKNSELQKFETATLGGGCFWCIEAAFNDMKGVKSAISGYSGGTIKNPSYREVTSGRTGHAEVVQISYDPAVLSYDDVLKIFFSLHDPTTLNRQGADVGTQYRSIILYHDDVQREKAEKVIVSLNGQKKYKNPIVTEVTPFKEFYRAEEYHQEYFRKNPNEGYCKVVIEPKIEKFRIEFRDLLK
jgi:peptide-methionine (S)-S-oxide reductase